MFHFLFIKKTRGRDTEVNQFLEKKENTGQVQGGYEKRNDQLGRDKCISNVDRFYVFMISDAIICLTREIVRNILHIL